MTNQSYAIQNVVFFFILLVIFSFLGYFAVVSIVQVVSDYTKEKKLKKENESLEDDNYEYPDTRVSHDTIRDSESIMSGIERLQKQYNEKLDSSPIVQKLKDKGKMPQDLRSASLQQIHPGVLSSAYDDNTYKKGEERSFWSLLFIPGDSISN